MKELKVIFTCFNRREKTVSAMKSLVDLNPSIKFHFIVVDDNSSDGTVEAIKKLNYDTHLIPGTGQLFWCGGMRVGIDYYLNNSGNMDCLLVNDDVIFAPNAIEKMVSLQNGRRDIVIVGATCDKYGNFTYGLRKHRDNKSIWLNPVLPNREEIAGDTMNANCVLIPKDVLVRVGNMDLKYSHSLGDYDLGFKLVREGFTLISSSEYIGICEENGFENSWRDPKVPRIQRLKKKESPKGNPHGEWYYFLRKNYGMWIAIKYSITPYIRIMLGK